MARSLTQNSKLKIQNSIWLWLGAIAVAIAVGVTPPLYTAAAIAGIAVTIFILRKPVWGAYALVLSVPVQKAVTLTGGITVTQVLFVFVLGVWWAWLALRSDRRVVLTPIAIALFLFLAAALASLWNTTSMSESLAEVSRWLVTILAYVIIVNSVQTRREMNILIAVMLLAGMSEALLGLVQAYSGIGPESFNVGGFLTRAYGTIGAPNSFAGYINMSLPLATALAVYHIGKWISARNAAHVLDRPSYVTWEKLRVPLFMALVAVVLFWTVLTTLSRGAWVGLAFGVFAMVLALGKRAASALGTLFGAVLAVVGLGAAGALPPTVIERFGLLIGQLSIFDPRGIVPTPDDYAIIERMVHWQVAGNMFLSSPWVGVGIGNFNVLFNTFEVQGWPYSRGHAHNYYLHTLAETGIVGLTFYLLMIITAVVVGIGAIRRARSAGDVYGEAVAIGALGILITFTVHNIFENLHALNMGIHWGAALALFTLVNMREEHGSRDNSPQRRRDRRGS